MKSKKKAPLEAIGELSVNVQGFGFVKLDDGDSLFVPPGYLGGAVTGDKVLAVIDPQSDPERPVAAVKRIIERKFGTFIGCLVPLRGKHWGIRPLRRELPGLLGLTDESVARSAIPPREGNWAKAELPVPTEDFPPEELPYATLLDSYGSSGNVTADLDAIVAEYRIPEPYTDEDENGMNGDNPDTNSTADGNGDGNEKERSRQQILDEITGQLNLFPDDEE